MKYAPFAYHTSHTRANVFYEFTKIPLLILAIYGKQAFRTTTWLPENSNCHARLPPVDTSIHICILIIIVASSSSACCRTYRLTTKFKGFLVHGMKTVSSFLHAAIIILFCNRHIYTVYNNTIYIMTLYSSIEHGIAPVPKLRPSPDQRILQLVSARVSRSCWGSWIYQGGRASLCCEGGTGILLCLHHEMKSVAQKQEF